MTIGTLVAFTALQSSLFRPLMGLLNVGGLGDQLAGAVRPHLRVPRPAGRDRRPGRPGRRSTPSGSPGTCGSSDVTFTYPGSARRRRRRASAWTSRPARTLALVGETGSGKSTLASLVARLYDPTGGAHHHRRHRHLRDMRLADLAQIVGVVSQETYLLHTTVRENLRYAKPDATDAEIEDAARAAQIHDLISSLPDGYDTMVGSRGHRFSGGEKQRIAIARTLLRDPRVLRAGRGDQRAGHRDRAGRAAGVRRARRTAGRPSPSRTGSRPFATPTRSRCSTTATSSNSAPTPRCWPTTAATPRSPPDARRRSHPAGVERGNGCLGAPGIGDRAAAGTGLRPVARSGEVIAGCLDPA